MQKPNRIDRDFYKKVLLIAIPIIIQNGITQFVSLLDNIMVGSVGQLPMSGVAIANQLVVVFNICIFGATSGAGIFTAQFHGKKDYDGVRHTFRFKLLACLAVVCVGVAAFLLGGRDLIRLYLTGEGKASDAEQILDYGMQYLRLMVLGLLPFAITNTYSTTLRESGQTVVPMVGSVSAVLTNLVLNWVLIFGHFGLPAMGVRGAAVATVVSRYVELAIVATWTHTHGKQHPFIKGAYRSLYIPGTLLGSIAQKGLPLLANEFLWAAGIAVVSQSYSTLGLSVVPAVNIADVIKNLSSVVHMAIGNAVGIIMGQLMGSGAPAAEVRHRNRQVITLGVLAGACFGVVLAVAAPFFPMIYRVSDDVKHLATRMIWVYAVMMPVNAFTLSAYFTLRSGGKTLTTMLFDSCFLWCAMVPTAFCLTRFTALPVLTVYILCQATDILRASLGAWMVHRGKWIRNLTVQ